MVIISAARKLQNKQANAVIYARYSSHGQQEQSIEGQLRDCYAYAEREGIIIVGEYIEACDILEPTQRIQSNQGVRGLVTFFKSISHSRGLCRAT